MMGWLYCDGDGCIVMEWLYCDCDGCIMMVMGVFVMVMGVL